MAIFKSTIVLLLTLGSQAIVIPANTTEFPILESTKLQPIDSEPHPTRANPVFTRAAPIKPAHAHHTSLDPADVKNGQPGPEAHSEARVPIPASSNNVKAAPEVQPKGFDLRPDPTDHFMAGMPTWMCNFRFQLSGKKDHYFLRGRNWNITGEEIESAVKKVVYNTPEWGAMPAGGADVDGKYLPGKETPEDTITFKYSDALVPDLTTGDEIQEFAAEWFIPNEPKSMTRDLEVEFERMLVNRPMYTAARTLGIWCGRTPDDEDSPWHPVVQASDIGGNATVEVRMD